MPNIDITVTADRAATVQGAPCIVCGNSDYTVTFTFTEAELWSAYKIKTARFVYQAKGEMRCQDVPFEGDTVSVPVLSQVREVQIGVYAGDLHTTTPARVPCERSILCWEPKHDDPEPDVYNRLLELLNGGGNVNTAAQATTAAGFGTVATATSEEE